MSDLAPSDDLTVVHTWLTAQPEYAAPELCLSLKGMRAFVLWALEAGLVEKIPEAYAFLAELADQKKETRTDG